MSFPVNNAANYNGTASEHRSEAPSWTQGLTRYGKYYTGIVEESNLDKILELHKKILFQLLERGAVAGL